MNDHLEQFLGWLAAEGEAEAHFEPAAGQELAAFQSDVKRLYRYELLSLLQTGAPRYDGDGGNYQISRIRVRLTPAGVRKWGPPALATDEEGPF
jgi:hypothetical protein